MAGSTLRSRIEEVADELASLCAELDPAALAAFDVEPVFDSLVAIGKHAQGAVLRLTDRYDELGAWKRAGDPSAADHRARKTGTSPSAARRAADTSKRLGSLPATDAALRNGALSPDQADQVAAGAAASPADEDDLLDAARREPLHNLRRKAAAARAKADADPAARHRRQHRSRRVSRWVDEDGLYNLHLRTTPDRGAEIDAHLKPRIDHRYAEARDAGRYEPYQAYAADAATDLLTGRTTSTHRPRPPANPPDHGAGHDASSTTDDEPPTDDEGRETVSRVPARSKNQAVRPDRKVIATIDLAALNRGWTRGDETAEIAGIGPVPVNVIRSMLADAFITLVIEDGTDIRNVTHLGRRVTAHQRSALERRGYACEVDGCGSTHHLDIDHVTGFTLTQTTTLDDLAWLCGHHHDRKTHEDLVLRGPIGRRQLVPRPPPDASTPRRNPSGHQRRSPPRDPPTLFTTAT